MKPGTVYFYHEQYGSREVDIYEQQPDMYVGFDNEIKAQAFQMLLNSPYLDKQTAMRCIRVLAKLEGNNE